MCDISSLKQALTEGKVTVTFVKADGSTRVMLATQNHQYLPPQDHNTTTKEPKSTKIDENLIKVYDLEVKGWRSFRAERVQSWHKIQ